MTSIEGVLYNRKKDYKVVSILAPEYLLWSDLKGKSNFKRKKVRDIGHLGFSYVGLIYLLMLFIPNILWTKYKPEGYESIVGEENKILLLFERVGQVAVTCTVLIFSDFNIGSFNLWSIWLLISFLLMLMYEMNWIRYFRGEHTLKSFYGSFCGFPVAGASLPVLAFFLLSIYGKVIWLSLSVILLGIGHIGIHLQHLKAIK